MSDWDVFTPPTTRSGDFPEPFKFDTIGVAIVGTITAIRRAGPFGPDQDYVPELYLDTDDGARSVLCGPKDLYAKLYEAKPSVGDRIAIKYTHQEKRGSFMGKVFDVAVGPAGVAPVSADVKINAPVVSTAADLL